MANQLAEVDNHSIQYVTAKNDRIGAGTIALYSFRFVNWKDNCCVNLGTQRCMQYHSYRSTI